MKMSSRKNMSFLLLAFVLITQFTSAQTGKIDVIKDSRIEALVEKQSEVIPPEVNPQIDGYRIQLFFDSDKNLVNDAKARFLNKFRTIDTYVKYNAPNFFLRAGDFRTRLEAERIRAQIVEEFPTSFVVKEKINLPRLEKEELPD